MNMEASSDKPKDPTRRGFLGKAAALGAAGLAGAALVHSKNEAERRTEESERGLVSVHNVVMQDVLKSGGTVKMELKLDSTTGKLKVVAEIYNKDGKHIPGGYFNE